MMNTLKLINNTDNELFNDNIIYLKNLYKSLNFILVKLNKNVFNDIFIYEVFKYLNLFDSNIMFFNNISFSHYYDLSPFLSLTIKRILKFNSNIPKYINNINKKYICIIYHLFFNNIMTFFINFINYYNDYFNKLIEILNVIDLLYPIAFDDLNFFISNEKINNKSNKYTPFFFTIFLEKELICDKLSNYRDYIAQQINNYTFIKSILKNLNISFLYSLTSYL